MRIIGLYGDQDPENQLRSHDHALGIVEKGDVVFHMELERFTGVKHDGRMPEFATQLLAQSEVDLTHAKYAVVNSFLSNYFCSKDHHLVINEQGAGLNVPQMFIELEDGNFLVSHEIAHLGACLPFFGGFKANSLLVHFDGGASESCVSVWHFDGENLSAVHHSWHPDLKRAINNFNANPLSARILGIGLDEHLSMPGKLMGLASFGRYRSELHKNLCANNWYLDEVFPGELDFQMGADIAICMQREFEQQIVSFISEYQAQFNADYLYYSGGAGLNIHANVRIERECGFKTVFIPPAPSDAGLAIGAAAFVDWFHNKRFNQHGAYLNAYQLLPNWSELATISPLKLIDSIEQAAALIAKGEVIAVFHGNSEIGPRALGHRSLIARADDIELRKTLSETMKQREWYRPVAPMMLPHIAKQALKDVQPDSLLTRFMLGAWQVNESWTDAFSGCIHADNTVRAQVIDETENLELTQLLTLLEQQHQIFSVINTSFNARGKPIVHTIEQAIEQALAMNVKHLWVIE